ERDCDNSERTAGRQAGEAGPSRGAGRAGGRRVLGGGVIRAGHRAHPRRTPGRL
ncbi:MAG: hypothetical protein AVDCRST_MAG72-379, partial [uncultured Nocardioidaceae bacterium]